MKNLGHKTVVTVSFSKPYFIHAVTVVQDLWGVTDPDNASFYVDDRERLQLVTIYIGNDSTYTNNPKCNSKPLLDTSELSSFQYLFWETDVSTRNEDDVWNYGFEEWCNMWGQYVSLEINLKDSPTVSSDYEQSICNLGIFGTIYDRDPPMASGWNIIKVQYLDTWPTIAIKDISAQIAIGNTLDIMH